MVNGEENDTAEHSTYVIHTTMFDWDMQHAGVNVRIHRMFIGPCIIVIVEELKTNLMSLVIFISLIICSTCFGH